MARLGKINGFSLCKQGPKLTHMFFADDILLFCRANSKECSNVLNLLFDYESTFGQKVNRDKMTIFFSANLLQKLKKTNH